MKKIVILFLSLIVLTPITSLALDQNTLPPLPPAFEQESDKESAEQQAEDTDQKSLWQKIKSFFGFGEEKEKTEDKQQVSKDTSQDLKEPEQVKVVEKEKEVVAKIEEAVESPKIETQPVQPMDSIDNGQQAVIDKVNQEQGNLINSTSVSTPIEPEASLVNQGNTGIQLPVNTDQQAESDQLQLLAGFGDENQDVSKTTNATSIPQMPEAAPSVIAPEPVTTNIPNAEPVQPSQLELPTAPEENTEPKEDEKNLATPDSNTSSASEDVASVKNDVNDIKPPSVIAAPSLPQENEAAPAVVVPEETKVELPKPETQSVEKVDNVSSPTPAYAGGEVEKNTKSDEVKSDDASTKSDSLVSKYTKQIQNSKSIKELPKITSDEIEKSDGAVPEEKVDDGKQLKFIEDEAKVLSIPNDDVVLGELTNEAKLEQIDFREYVIKFWEFYNTLAREPKRKEIDNFIQKFDDNAEYSR